MVLYHQHSRSRNSLDLLLSFANGPSKLSQEAHMGKKLYVGNLSYSVDSAQLSDLFTQVGSVDSANVIMDRETGRSKGFAFVEMAEDSHAQAAIEKFNGTDLGGRAMNVSEAKPQAPREGGGGGGGRGGGGGFGRRY
jgi:RNA recognition motif-containing protein